MTSHSGTEYVLIDWMWYPSTTARGMFGGMLWRIWHSRGIEQWQQDKARKEVEYQCMPSYFEKEYWRNILLGFLLIYDGLRHSNLSSPHLMRFKSGHLIMLTGSLWPMLLLLLFYKVVSSCSIPHMNLTSPTRRWMSTTDRDPAR